VRLLCVATVTPRKGHALLLQALAGLKPLNWQLHCVGSLTRDPATRAAVRALARDSGLADRIIWHGEVDAAALQAQYAAADLLVLASLHEGYGMVVAEALAAGLPVLATDAGALAQTLPPAAGWRVPAGDVPALQAALQTLVSDSALRARLAAGARAAGRLLPDWATQAARFAAVLDSV
jgi:glycosyltransferase involved in cell wall biosynthesis